MTLVADPSMLLDSDGERHSLGSSLLGSRVWDPLGEMSQDPKFSVIIKGLDVILRVLGSHGRFLSREERGADTGGV